MQIYFEDGKLINSKLLPIIPNFIINAEDGVTSCINQLDDINSVKLCAIIYTNSIFALNGKYAWNNKTKMHDIFIRNNENGCFERICDFTPRELREGHNIGKMYVTGEFN